MNKLDPILNLTIAQVLTEFSPDLEACKRMAQRLPGADKLPPQEVTVAALVLQLLVIEALSRVQEKPQVQQ